LRNIFSSSLIALLVSACGAKSQLGNYYSQQTQDQGYQQSLINGYGAGSLPQVVPWVSSGQSASVNQNTSASPVTSLPSSQVSLGQTAQDFGYLNTCFQSISQQAGNYFQMGIGSDDVFRGAGQALVKCYNDVIKARTDQMKQLQAYQTELYRQNYINQMFATYLAISRQQASAAQFTVARPPGAR